ncbi:Leucine-rich_repeat-containing protein [Hexamita inflata]|uniref:Leucine-rich repeat-containing protein n=1 Tax=Hexamita inflata TaxID=28002 RepID=A0AA86N9U7_9EUKA|nr:Leucine-rich repeat-containing protein [Hexamita inflata]
MDRQTQCMLVDTITKCTNILEIARFNNAMDDLLKAIESNNLDAIQAQVTILMLPNSFIDDTLEQFQFMKKVIFNVLNNNIISSIIKLAMYPNLIYLDLSRNKLTTIGFTVFWRSQKRLRFVLLDGNSLTDASEVLSLNHLKLVYLSLKGNKFKHYVDKVREILPNLQCLDGEVFSYVHKTQFAENYLCSAYFQKHKIILPPPKIELKFQENMKNVLKFCMGLNTAQGQVCPVLLIQRYVRKFRAIVSVTRYRQHKMSATVKIQSILKMLAVYKKYHYTIRKTVILKTKAIKVILQNLRLRKEFRSIEHQIFQKLRERQAVEKIKYNLRLRHNVKLDQKISEGLVIYITKTFDTEHGAMVIFKKLAKYVMDDIAVALLSYQESDHVQFNQEQHLKFVQTNYQLVSERHDIWLQRSAKSLTESQHIQLKQFMPIKQQVANSKFQKNLVSQYSFLENSVAHKVNVMLQNIPRKIFKQTTAQIHEQSENTANSYFYKVTITHRDLSCIIIYLLVNKQNYELKTPEEKKMYKFGTAVFNQIMPNGTRNYLNDLFRTHEIPSFLEKSDFRQKLVIVSQHQILYEAAAMKIQKMFKMKIQNKKTIKEFSNQFLQYKSIQEIFMVQRAVKIIQKRVRGVFGRCRHLIFQKMRDAFESGIQHQCFLISKQAYAQLSKNKIVPSHFLKGMHVNLSPPLSSTFTHKIFTDGSDPYVMQKVQELGFQMGGLTQQLINVPELLPNLFGALTSNLLGAATLQYLGFVQIQSKYFTQSPFYSTLLKTWSSSELPLEFMGVKIKSQTREKVTDIEFGFDALKVVSGLRHVGQQESKKSDKFLADFDVKVIIDKIDYRELNSNILQAVYVEELNVDRYIQKEFRSVLRRYADQYLLIRPHNSKPEDVALKALLLELTYNNPMNFECVDTYTARKYEYLTKPDITTSIQAFQKLGAAIQIQTAMRKYSALYSFKKMPVHCTLIKKINQLFTQDDTDPQALGIQREQAAINLIQCAHSRKIESELLAQQKVNNPITIKQPPIRDANRTDKLKREKLLQATEQRYGTCVTKSANDLMKAQILQENKLRIAAVKEITKNFNSKKESLQKLFSQIISLNKMFHNQTSQEREDEKQKDVIKTSFILTESKARPKSHTLNSPRQMEIKLAPKNTVNNTKLDKVTGETQNKSESPKGKPIQIALEKRQLQSLSFKAQQLKSSQQIKENKENLAKLNRENRVKDEQKLQGTQKIVEKRIEEKQLVLKQRVQSQIEVRNTTKQNMKARMNVANVLGAIKHLEDE